MVGKPQALQLLGLDSLMLDRIADFVMSSPQSLCNLEIAMGSCFSGQARVGPGLSPYDNISATCLGVYKDLYDIVKNTFIALSTWQFIFDACRVL